MEPNITTLLILTTRINPQYCLARAAQYIHHRLVKTSHTDALFPAGYRLATPNVGRQPAAEEGTQLLHLDSSVISLASRFCSDPLSSPSLSYCVGSENV